MLNFETVGSKKPILRETNCSIPVIYNEDQTILCYISSQANPSGKGITPYSITGSGVAIIECKKVWDTSSNPKIFYVALRYASGQTGNPDGTEVEHGQIIPIFRVGEYNSKGGYGLELHSENSSKYSWVSFVNTPAEETGEDLIIKDLGNGNGVQVKYENGVWVEIGSVLALQTTGGAGFYGSPFLKDNLYIGAKTDNKFYVSRSGYSQPSKTYTVTNVSLGVDFCGKVVTFEGI